MFRNCKIPCLRTWSIWGLTSGQSSGVPRERSPIGLFYFLRKIWWFPRTCQWWSPWSMIHAWEHAHKDPLEIKIGFYLISLNRHPLQTVPSWDNGQNQFRHSVSIESIAEPSSSFPFCLVLFPLRVQIHFLMHFRHLFHWTFHPRLCQNLEMILVGRDKYRKIEYFDAIYPRIQRSNKSVALSLGNVMKIPCKTLVVPLWRGLFWMHLHH